ncbi:MAG: hexose kinase, partial [Clostridiales bacterium]|nr:hexose kinase [Clostridiales bacterium]
IITLTLCPAFDVHCAADIELHHENLAKISRTDAGGKGINISRALAAGNIDNHAVIALGSENGGAFLKELENEKFDIIPVFVSGKIRENITLHEQSGSETRICFEGFEADISLLDTVLEKIKSIAKGEFFLTLTGRLPKGISVRDALVFIEKIKSAGAKIVIDSKSFELSDIIAAKPYLIKPNAEEASEYAKKEISDISDASDFAENLRGQGAGNVMITLGEKGAVLACDSGIYASVPPKINVLSTVGAGDSAIAGFLASKAAGKSDAEALQNAVAYGTAVCMTVGTSAPDKAKIDAIFGKTSVAKIK